MLHLFFFMLAFFSFSFSLSFFQQSKFARLLRHAGEAVCPIRLFFYFFFYHFFYTHKTHTRTQSNKHLSTFSRPPQKPQNADPPPDLLPFPPISISFASFTFVAR